MDPHTKEPRGRWGRNLAVWSGIAAVAVASAALATWRPKADVDRISSATEGGRVEEAASDGSPWLADMTAASGVDFVYRNGEEANRHTILESLGGGVAMIDYDGDGLLDLFFPGGGHFDGDAVKGRPCKLFKNLGGWKFRDVTAETGLDAIDFYSHGCAVADFDRDGWPDLLVTGYGRLALFRNEKGATGRRFAEVAKQAGLIDSSWSTSAAWGDFFGTGYPDLYVCHYLDWSFANHPFCGADGAAGERDVCPPQRFKPLVHALYRNQGNGSFRDATAEQKLRNDGCGLGVVVADFRGDGKPGIYVANDATNNHLYVHVGGRLEERGMEAGVAVDDHGMYNGSMGVDAADYDGRGRASLFVANFQGELHALYQNLAADRFGYQSHAAGLGALGRQFVGFGAAFADFDNDGWEDLAIANGHVLRKPRGSTLKQKPLLLRNVESNGRHVFRNVSNQGGPAFNGPAVGRGIAVGDLDNDGWPDLVIVNTNSPAILLRNIAGDKRNAHWIGVRLLGRDGRDPAGSTVTLEVGGRHLTRFAKGGGSYLSSGDRRLLFGLGSTEKVGVMKVRWSWGAEQTWEGLAADQYWDLREGEPKATVPKDGP